MTSDELINRLIKEAKKFRADKDWLERNRHMHNASRSGIRQDDIDAVLTGFLNHFAANACCLDLAFYASDFEKEPPQ